MNEDYRMTINADTKGTDLYNFIKEVMSFNEVIELYKLLKYKIDFQVDMQSVNEYCEIKNERV